MSEEQIPDQLSETMLSPSEFESLVRLLDDDSDTVRNAVGRRLLDYEEALPEYVSNLDPLPSSETFALMNRVIREAKCETLTDHWEDVLTELDPHTRLEHALGLVSDYLDRTSLRSGRLTRALDELADELRGTAPTPIALSQALFGDGRFAGNRADYYAPENSSILTVIESGEGNPISLACLFILVGKRLGHEIGGCNFPGHFLSVIPRGDAPILVDCFNAGRLVAPDDLVDTSVSPVDADFDLFEPASPEVILLRVLRNLERAFHQLDEERERSVIEHLIERMLVSGSV